MIISDIGNYHKESALVNKLISIGIKETRVIFTTDNTKEWGEIGYVTNRVMAIPQTYKQLKEAEEVVKEFGATIQLYAIHEIALIEQYDILIQNINKEKVTE